MSNNASEIQSPDHGLVPRAIALGRAGALLVAAGCLVVCVALGLWMRVAGEPAILWSVERAWVNHGTLIAWWLTWSCYPQVLAPLCIVLLVVTWRDDAKRRTVVFAIGCLLFAWVGTDIAQHLFGRPRRLDWVVKHETSFSYPSSHAAISTAFYGLWGYLAARSRYRGHWVVASLLVALVAGTLWSRLALGAHYATDLAGGILLGATVVFAGAAWVRR